MKIAYVSTYDARDQSYWSGSGYFIWRSLASCGINVELIGPLSLPPIIEKILKVKQAFHSKGFRNYYIPEHDLLASKAYSRSAWKRLQHLKEIDAVVSPGSIPVAFLSGTLPVVTISDCTHRSLFEAYPAYKNLCRATRRHGDKIERAAMKRASASIFASDWAADSAIRDYDAEPAKVHIVPFGANFECQPAHNDVVRSIQSREFNKLRLLFIGVEWERKGGRIALDVVRKLIQLGIPAHLTVVGCEPAISAKDAQYVSVQGFIKKTVEGQKKINNFLSQSHFLIVPSEAECYGLVFCEASAFGVPSIARNVGGVGTIIKSDVNGRLFDYHTTAKDMVDWIISFYREPEKYHRLALLTLAEYESRLNWGVAGEKIKKILNDVISVAKNHHKT